MQLFIFILVISIIFLGFLGYNYYINNVANSPIILTQEDMIQAFGRRITEAHIYKKFGVVQAKQVTTDYGVLVETHTSSGKETTNTAKFGDWIITNPGGEKYVIDDTKFKERYTHIVHEDYMPVGKVKAYEYRGGSFMFRAKWGETVPVNDGDFLCTPYPHTILQEVYRIDRKEFFQTYKID